MDNLLDSDEPKFHNDLFYGPINERKEKESYTQQDVWNYFVFSTKGSLTTAGKFSDHTREEREQLKQDLLEDSREPTEKEIKWMETYIEKYGVQVILFAIDAFVSTSWEEDSTLYEMVPEINLVSGTIHSGAVYYSSLLRDYSTRDIL